MDGSGVFSDRRRKLPLMYQRTADHIVRNLFKILAIYVEQSSTIIAKIQTSERTAADCRANE